MKQITDLHAFYRLGATGVLNDVYNMSGISNSTLYTFSNNNTYASIWEQHLPLSDQNSLWFSGVCLIWGLIGKNSKYHSPPACQNYCTGPLGLEALIYAETPPAPPADTYSGDGMTLDTSASRPSGTSWTVPWIINGGESLTQNLTRPWYKKDGLQNLNVRYCLVEEHDPVCKVGLMNTLFGVTAICVVTKALLCIVVLARLSDKPLVTPGDAIESFILQPDPTTIDKATLSAGDFTDGHLVALAPGPRQWKRYWRSFRLASGVPKMAWARTYLLCIVVLSIVAGLLSLATSSESLKNGYVK